MMLSAIFYLVLSGCGNLPQGRYGQEAVKVAVMPAYSTAVMGEKYLPVLDRLSRETGFDVQFITTENISGFGAGVENSGAQLVLCDAFAYLTLRKTKNTAILAIGNDSLGSALVSGLIITTAENYDRGLNAEAKLKDKLICCTSKQTAEGYLSQALLMLGKGVDPNHGARIVAVGGFDKVIEGLATGKFEAGFITRLMWNEALAKRYRILAYGQPVPGWVMVSLQGGNTEIDQKIKEALLALDPAKPEDKKILYNIGLNRFSADYPEELDKLNLEADKLGIPY